VKTNIGHLEGAAGLAGLIKVVLSLQHREIPASLHFRTANPRIPFAELPLHVQQSLGDWPQREHPPRAGVNSFGFGGTNAHVILEEAPPGDRPTPIETDSPQVLLLSARSPQALQDVAGSFQKHLSSTDSTLQDLCYSASVRRTHHDHRLAMVVRSHRAAARNLAAFARQEARPGMVHRHCNPEEPHQPVFVFSGQGPQWWAMGRQLLQQEPVYRRALEECDALVRQLAGWSLLDELAADEQSSRMRETEIAQPAIFALQVALAAQWQSWGVQPAAVLGHSVGELAAAYTAGVLTLEDASRVVLQRCRLMQQVTGHGRMAAADLTLEQARQAVAPYRAKLSIASVNSPQSVVFSGDPQALQELCDGLESTAAFTRYLSVDYAFHSPQMEPFQRELEQELQGLSPQAAALPIYSTVTAKSCHGREFDAAYWSRQLREPVFFAATIEQLITQGHRTYLEIGPHPVLSGYVSQCLHQQGCEGQALASLRRGEEERASLLGSLGALHTLGVPVDWKPLYSSSASCVALPGYPWQRERCWLEVSEDESRFTWEQSAKEHPYLRHRVPAVHAAWNLRLDGRRFDYLEDHKVQGTVVLPGAAYVEMALAGLHAGFEPDHWVLTDVEFSQALTLPEEEARLVQLAFSPEGSGEWVFHVYGRSAAVSSAETWTLHATGHAHATAAPGTSSERANEERETLQARCTEEICAADLYRLLHRCGLQYGPAFQGIAQLWRGEGEVLARLKLDALSNDELAAYRLHPVLLDACFQAVAASISEGQQEGGHADVFLPVHIDLVRLLHQPSGELWVHVRLQESAEQRPETLRADLRLFAAEGPVIAEVEGLHLKRLDHGASTAASENPEDWLYQVQWEHFTGRRQVDPACLFERGSWLIFADRSGVADQLARQLKERGEQCVLVSANPQEQESSYGLVRRRIDPSNREQMIGLVNELLRQTGPPWRGVIHLWSLDGGPDRTQAETLGSLSVLSLVQALAPYSEESALRLWLVTRGAQHVAADPVQLSVLQSPLWGLARVIGNEYPGLACSTLDLDPRANQAGEALFGLLWEAPSDHQMALRGEHLYVARLARRSRDSTEEAGGLSLPASHGYRLDITRPGLLDSLSLVPSPARKAARGEVQIQVRAAGLNFRDVMKAMGIYPTDSGDLLWLGDECSGVIVATGADVTGLTPGDEVLAVAPACFGSTATVPADLVVKKPEGLSFAEAATIPIAFTTAYYGLHHLARLQRGERVLIHAATGGVGLAALQVARWKGAEIYATAGSEKKRALLRSLGVEHVMDSRSLSFADEILELTGGEGVDVVLNSLAGKAIARSLGVLRPFGRFLEIGKRDLYQNTRLGLKPFKNHLAFHSIDMARVYRERRSQSGELLGEVVGHLERGTFQAPVHTVYPLIEAIEAFRQMARGQHIGKLVLAVEHQQERETEGGSTHFNAESSYLITGGRGSLGLQVAQWMVRQGARSLVLVGRSAPSPASEESVQQLREEGARVLMLQADVGREAEVRALLKQIQASLPPLRGVFHAAGVLDDGLLLEMDADRFQAVLAPKVQGAWNLHLLTQDMELDCFVLFSSVSSLLGTPGQGNYAAANAFLDALSHHRRALGLPTLSINWGPWAADGMAAELTAAQRMLWRGLHSIEPEKGLEALGLLLEAQEAQEAQVGVFPIQWQEWFEAHPSARSMPLLADLAEEANSAGSGQRSAIREVLLRAEPAERPQMLESYACERLAKVLQIDPAKLEVDKPLNSIGMDSLMAVEFKTRAEDDLGITLPMVSLIEGPSLKQLVAKMLDLLTQSPAESSKGGVSSQQHRVPLSLQQEQRLRLQQQASDRPLRCSPLVARVRGPLRIDLLEESLERVLHRQPVLRMTLCEVAEETPQAVISERTEPLRKEDLRTLPQNEQTGRLRERLGEEAARPCELTRGPLLHASLFVLGAQDHVLLLSVHALLADERSIGVILQQLSSAYEAACADTPANGAEPQCSYADFARWQRASLATLPDGQRSERSVLHLTPDRLPAKNAFGPVALLRSELPGELVGSLEAGKEGVSWRTLGLAGLQLLLHELSGEERFLIGLVRLSDRSALQKMIGPLDDVLALPADLSEPLNHRELLGQVQKIRRRSGDCPELFSELRQNGKQHSEVCSLLPVTIAFEKQPRPQLHLCGVETEMLATEGGVAWRDLQLVLSREGQRLTATWIYRTECLDELAVRGIARRFAEILRRIVADPEERVRAPEVASPAAAELVETSQELKVDDDGVIAENH
jgi:acyl transferase domain-containing protein/acyl carrier protein